MKTKNKGMTLISLVITIIILIILATITLSLVIRENGIIEKANEAATKTEKQVAIESINLKITQIQIEKYSQENRLPTLQELADKLCEDKDMEYVTLESKKVADLEKIQVGDATSIYVKIKQYPYEFEINASLQLASIDGVNVATSDLLTDEQYNELLNKIQLLENKIQKLKPVQLYSGSAKGNFTLSQSIDNFNTIEIIYRLNTSSNGLANRYMKVTPAELKSGVSLNAYSYCKDGSYQYIQLFSCGLTINETTATRGTTTYSYNEGISTKCNTVSSTGNIHIVEVKGYY